MFFHSVFLVYFTSIGADIKLLKLVTNKMYMPVWEAERFKNVETQQQKQ